MDLEVITLRILPAVADSIKQHSKKEADKGGYEAVGFVASKLGKSVGVATLRFNNHAAEPQHGFFVEPWEQYRAEKKLEQAGLEPLAVYHSHVNSEALPSQMDHRYAWPGSYVLLYSVIFDDLKAYREADGALKPVELAVKKGGL